MKILHWIHKKIRIYKITKLIREKKITPRFSLDYRQVDFIETITGENLCGFMHSSLVYKLWPDRADFGYDGFLQFAPTGKDLVDIVSACKPTLQQIDEQIKPTTENLFHKEKVKRGL